MVLIGTELVFFIEACKMLCFRLLMKTVAIIPTFWLLQSYEDIFPPKSQKPSQTHLAVPKKEAFLSLTAWGIDY